MPATVLKNKVMYRQFIDSVAFVNWKCCTCLKPSCLYFPDTPCNWLGILNIFERRKSHFFYLKYALRCQIFRPFDSAAPGGHRNHITRPEPRTPLKT
jgi:hypothetical protein